MGFIMVLCVTMCGLFHINKTNFKVKISVARMISFTSRIVGKNYPFFRTTIPRYTNPNGIYLINRCRYSGSRIFQLGSLVCPPFSHKMTSFMDRHGYPLTVMEFGQNISQKDAEKVDVSIIIIFMYI
jgi:hypothetical protein